MMQPYDFMKCDLAVDTENLTTIINKMAMMNNVMMNGTVLMNIWDLLLEFNKHFDTGMLSPTPAPTGSPTTPVPTAAPTAAPSPTPTALPTMAPTIPHCTDGAFDLSLETDVDCGDTCPPCVHGFNCETDDDCVSELMCLSGTCEYVPTSLPIPSPTAAPTLVPSASSFISIAANVGLSGLNCAEYGSTEEELLVTAIASTINGVEEHNIGATQCTDSTRRRRRDLLEASDSVSIEFSISISTSNLEEGSADFAASVNMALAAAVSSGELSANLAAATVAANSSSVIGAVVVTSASLSTHAPTPSPIARDSAAPLISLGLVHIAGGCGLLICMACLCACLLKKVHSKSRSSGRGYADAGMFIEMAPANMHALPTQIQVPDVKVQHPPVSMAQRCTNFSSSNPAYVDVGMENPFEKARAFPAQVADIQPQNVQVTTDQVQSNFTQEEIMKQQTQDRPRELGRQQLAAAERGPEEVAQQLRAEQQQQQQQQSLVLHHATQSQRMVMQADGDDEVRPPTYGRRNNRR